MTIFEDAALLADMLDRHVRRVVDQKGARILPAAHALLEFIDSEPRLAGLARDALADSEDAWADYESVVQDALSKVRAIWEAGRDSLKPFPVPEWVAHHCRSEDGGPAESFTRALARPLEMMRRGGTRPREALGERLDILEQWLHAAFDEETKTWRDARLEHGADALRTIREELQIAWHRLRLHLESHPGPALVELRARTDRLIPARTRTSEGPDFVAVLRNRETTARWSMIDGNQERVEGGVVAFREEVIADYVQRLNLALQDGLARGLSRRSMVRRFAARCESFDRVELLRQIKAEPGRAEAILTLTLARYLFDAGLNPLVDAAACGLRPDILDSTSEPAVYVEAKQFENVGAGVARSLREALAQTLNTWDRLAKRWNVPEAFLLIFRRSGQPIVLENPELHHAGRRLFVVSVDIASASESGRRADTPVRIDVRDLVGFSGNPNSSTRSE